MKQIKAAIIGGGVSGLMAAYLLSEFCEVDVYEKGKMVGRKFLVAGKGGLNITNSLVGEDLYSKYTPSTFLKSALKSFDSTALRNWLSKIGVSTYIGSSGRVFPDKAIKPNEVLEKIKEKLIQRGVNFYFHHEFVGFDKDLKPLLKNKTQELVLKSDYCIFALGGASWAKTGSDGSWIKYFENIGLKTQPFQASNCGISISWPKEFSSQFEGKPLKNIAISINEIYFKGEALITKYGLEGNVIYPIIPLIRKCLEGNARTYLTVDFKPQNSLEQLLEKIRGVNCKPKNYEYLFNLSKMQLNLIKIYTSKEDYLSPPKFIEHIKGLKIPVDSIRPIDEAISTVGGICSTELNTDFSIKKIPNYFVIGEMADWDAPTGGFLLQGCFSMAHQTAIAILKN